eukprot:g19998.t1
MPDSTSNGRFVLLDGMRGVAAVFIIQRHAEDLLGDALPSSYLGVDLFFALSGFVLAHAYGHALANGRISPMLFMKARLLRLYPLYLLALALVIAYYVHMYFAGLPVMADERVVPGELLLAIITGLLFLPSPVTISFNAALFLVHPAWSLFNELVANLAFALRGARATNRQVAAVIAISAVGLVIAAIEFHRLHAGFRWHEMYAGMARVFFSFFAGVLVYRFRRRTIAERPVVALACLSVLILVLAFPTPRELKPVFDLAVVVFVWPALLYLASAIEPGRRTAAISSFVGTASYAVYVLHTPILDWSHVFFPGMAESVCVYGAGALGGAFAAKMANGLGSDVDVSVIARGAQLEAIRSKGIRVVYDGDSEAPLAAKVRATEDPFALPQQDLIITGLKGHQLASAAEGIARLCKDNTRIIMILNGIPWWYFHQDADSGFAERQIPELDPGGDLWRLVGPHRVIGCVAYQGAEVIEPGCTKLNGSGHFFLGEPGGELSPDLQAIADLLGRASLDIRPTQRIRDEIWAKLRGNAAFNPISALTRALMADLMSDAGLSEMVRRVMNEVQAVGTSLGCRFSRSADEQFASAHGFGLVKTSMLQDLLARKPLEIVPLTGMVVSLGTLTGTPTPVCEVLLSLTRQLDVENRR